MLLVPILVWNKLRQRAIGFVNLSSGPPFICHVVSSNRSHLTSLLIRLRTSLSQKIFPPRTINHFISEKMLTTRQQLLVASPGSSCLSENIDHSRPGQQRHVHRPAPLCGGDSGIISAWCHVRTAPAAHTTQTKCMRRSWYRVYKTDRS